MKNQSSISSTILTLLIFCIGFYIQSQLILNMDVSLLMHTYERILAGGIYGRDFYESNPPLILYIYAPTVIFAKLFASSFITCIRIYIFALIAISLVFCHFLIKKISATSPVDYKSIVLLPSVAIALIILPGTEFGQREHIMAILIMPYSFLTMLRLLKEPLPSWVATLAGIMAGIGFCIKPHFFVAFFLLLLLTRKMYRENCIIFLMPILYFLIITIFHPTYLTDIVPLVLKYYYPAFNNYFDPWNHPAVYAVLATFIIYFISFYSIKNKIVENILCTLMLACLIIYFLQKTSWDYHIYPAMAFTILLIFQMIWRYSVLAKSLFSLKHALHSCCITILVIVSIYLLQYPITYTQRKNVNPDFEVKIINHLSKFTPGTSVYFLLMLPFVYPVIDYLPLKNNQVTQNFWFFPGIITSNAKTISKDRQHLRNIIITNILEQKPNVIVTTNLLSTTNPYFDILGFLATDETFRQFMQKYHTVDVYDNIAIYQHNDST